VKIILRTPLLLPVHVHRPNQIAVSQVDFSCPILSLFRCPRLCSMIHSTCAPPDLSIFALHYVTITTQRVRSLVEELQNASLLKCEVNQGSRDETKICENRQTFGTDNGKVTRNVTERYPLLHGYEPTSEGRQGYGTVAWLKRGHMCHC